MAQRVTNHLLRSFSLASRGCILNHAKNSSLFKSPGVSTRHLLASQDSYSTFDFDSFFSPYHGSSNAGSTGLTSLSNSEGASRSSFTTWILAGAIPICCLSSTSSVLAKEKPDVDLPREVILYQYEACPFCNKVKAYLDYRDIPYKVVEVNPLSKKELKWSDYKKVPVLMVDSEQLNDSSAIITKLEKGLFPESRENLGDEMDEEEKWRKWVDDHLVHLLAPNIYRSTTEALEAFDYITTHGNFSFFERAATKYAGAASMYFISKRLKKRHNIEDERESLYKAADEWVKALNGRDFMGGSKPNLADLATFGVLRPIRNLRAGEDLISHSSIGGWYERMEKEVGSSSRVD